MKITVMLPDNMDQKTRNCLNEIIKQTNMAIDELDRKYESIRREKNVNK